jgi:hypothetical protein
VLLVVDRVRLTQLLVLLFGELDVPRPHADAALRYAQLLCDDPNRQALFAFDQFHERMFA